MNSLLEEINARNAQPFRPKGHGRIHQPNRQQRSHEEFLKKTTDVRYHRDKVLRACNGVSTMDRTRYYGKKKHRCLSRSKSPARHTTQSPSETTNNATTKFSLLSPATTTDERQVVESRARGPSAFREKHRTYNAGVLDRSADGEEDEDDASPSSKNAPRSAERASSRDDVDAYERLRSSEYDDRIGNSNKDKRQKYQNDKKLLRTILRKKIEGAHAALKLRTQSSPARLKTKAYASLKKPLNSDDETEKINNLTSR